MPLSRSHPLQKLAWAYTAMFLFITFIAYVPGLTNAEGVTLGLFALDLKDNLLHFGSAVWAAFGAWRSIYASRFYFRLFGLVYFFDGVMGLIFGNGYLDFGIFTQGPIALDWLTKILANLPHLTIGGLAIFIGFVLSRELMQEK
jgi:hypothetical protein